MFYKRFAENSMLVILLSIFCLISNACSPVSSQLEAERANTGENSVEYGAPRVVGTIEENKINESSGLAASQCQTGVLWTHNDSGDKARIFALDARGKDLGTFVLKAAKNDDWEDMAIVKNENGECFLYVGDIGDNELARGELVIYKIKEPNVSDKSANQMTPIETLKVAYPDGRHNAETLLVHPATGDIYVLTKTLSGAAGVYKLAADRYVPGKTNKLEKISDFVVPSIPNGFLTGGSVSPDGRRVVIADYLGGYELILPEKAEKFDEIWKEKPLKVNLGERKQGEAVAYSADGSSIFATSEKRNSPLIEVKRK